MSTINAAQPVIIQRQSAASAVRQVTIFCRDIALPLGTLLHVNFRMLLSAVIEANKPRIQVEVLLDLELQHSDISERRIVFSCHMVDYTIRNVAEAFDNHNSFRGFRQNKIIKTQTSFFEFDTMRSLIVAKFIADGDLSDEVVSNICRLHLKDSIKKARTVGRKPK